jgi:hypothetical protein
VVAGHLAERAWAVMHRGMPYVICDTDGAPVTPTQAKAIIAENYTVPAEVRRRRRSTKTPAKAGKAPQQARAGHDRSDAPGADTRGDLPHPRSSANRRRTVNHPTPATAHRPAAAPGPPDTRPAGRRAPAPSPTAGQP